MKKMLIIFSLLVSLSSWGQTPEVTDFAGVEPHLSYQNDTTYIINFWATWCKPCIEELPAFLKLEEELKNKPFKLILVSLDFPSQIDSKLIPYLQKHKINSKVVVLDDPDSNSWIPKVDPSWSGSIPATVIYNKNHRTFYEQKFTYQELKQELFNHLNK